MKMRDLIKMNGPNDGTRTLYESILPNELVTALRDWSKAVPEPVLIGGVALSFYVRPRNTDDLDYLFISEQDVPEEVSGFKKARDYAFLHQKTHVEVEILTPEFLKVDAALVQKVYDTARTDSGVKIASPEGLVALKVQRGFLQDKADIVALLKVTAIDLTEWSALLTDEQKQMIDDLRTVAEKEEG